MNELQIFNNKEFGEIRAIEKNGEPWFVAKDICEALDITNTTDAMKRLDDDEVTRFNLGGLVGEVNIINEYGLYSLVLGSRKLEAKKFKRWITHEVIPSIRKYGSYSLEVPRTFTEALKLAAKQAEEIEALQLESAQSRQIISELQPKATYYDLILQNKSLLSATQIAKDYGMSAHCLNQKLHDLGIQYKQSETWLLYQRFADKGYTQSKTHAIDDQHNKLHTYWTQKGRLFIYDLLKSVGILPMIEREEERKGV